MVNDLPIEASGVTLLLTAKTVILASVFLIIDIYTKRKMTHLFVCKNVPCIIIKYAQRRSKHRCLVGVSATLLRFVCSKNSCLLKRKIASFFAK